MRERPILFSAPMVRALLAGTKTQTRRALSARSLAILTTAAKAGECYELGATDPIHPNDMACYVQFCPYGQPGDRLWVRESFWIEHDRDNFENSHSFDCGVDLKTADWASVCYCADQDAPGDWFGPDEHFPERAFLPWGEGPGLVPEFYSRRPSIHMPRWASRILLEVTAVRVERLQDISEADAIAEGLAELDDGRWLPGPCDYPEWAYHLLWDQINGAGSWDTNPWVWVVEFRRVES